MYVYLFVSLIRGVGQSIISLPRSLSTPTRASSEMFPDHTFILRHLSVPSRSGCEDIEGSRTRGVTRSDAPYTTIQ